MITLDDRFSSANASGERSKQKAAQPKGRARLLRALRAKGKPKPSS